MASKMRYNFFKTDLRVTRSRGRSQRWRWNERFFLQIRDEASHSPSPIPFFLTVCASFCWSLCSLLLSAAQQSAGGDSLKGKPMSKTCFASADRACESVSTCGRFTGEFICVLKAAFDAVKCPIHLSQLSSSPTKRQIALIWKISAWCQHKCNLSITCRFHPYCSGKRRMILLFFLGGGGRGGGGKSCFFFKCISCLFFFTPTTVI